MNASSVSRVLSTKFGKGVFSCAGHPKWGTPVFVTANTSAIPQAKLYLDEKGYESTLLAPNRLRVDGKTRR